MLNRTVKQRAPLVLQPLHFMPKCLGSPWTPVTAEVDAAVLF
jgi:hypothetical protein